MKAYYGRCMSIYGTKQEQEDIALIERLGYEVIKFPDQYDLNKRKAKGENVMETAFKPLVLSADTLFFRAVEGIFSKRTAVTAGVAKEVQWATEQGIPVLELPTDVAGRAVSIDRTREYLRKVGQR